MKIICIGRNYVDHIQELQNEIPESPVVFLKPETALLKNNDDFYYPPFSKEIHQEVELVFRIGKPGKYIKEKFAKEYVDGIGLGIDFTARDLQNQLKAKGLPWEKAKGFHGAAPISIIQDLEPYPDWENLLFSVSINGVEKQKAHSSMMIYKVPYLISHISTYFQLKKGDLIFTGTPKGVGPVQIGDRIQAFLEEQKLMDFQVR